MVILQKIVFYSRDGTINGREVRVERVLRVYPTPIPQPIEVCVSVVSSPGGVWGGAPSTTIFGCFLRFYACMQYASIIPQGSKSSLQRQRVTQTQSIPCLLSAGVETMETGLRLGSHMFYRCRRHHYSIVEHCKTKKSCPVLNFARFNSLVCIVARSREKSRSLSLAPFFARCRSLSLSLTGLMVTDEN